MFFPQQTPRFIQLLKSLHNQKVAVLAHISPDGDSIGSQVALCRTLNTLGIQSICITADTIPDTLQNFLGDTPFVTFDRFDPEGWYPINVDCADADRIGHKLKHIFSQQTWLNIDHHISNAQYGLHNLVDSTAAATCELLAGMFLDHSIPMDTCTAQALYLGITTDTGNFLFNATTARSLRIASELVNLGASPIYVCNELYHKEKLSKMHLLARFLENLRLEHAGAVCVGILRASDYESTHSTPDASGGFVNYLRSLKDIQIGIFLDIEQDRIKGSMRAQSSTLRLDLLAEQFAGGGHPAAAGFSVQEHFEVFYPRLLTAVKQHLISYT